VGRSAELAERGVPRCYRVPTISSVHRPPTAGSSPTIGNATRISYHDPPLLEHRDGDDSFFVWRFRAARASGAAPPASKPASAWIKADRLHPLIPRETPRFTALYRRRASVEREFGRLKHDWALAPLRVRGLDRVRLHADLTILAKLACALSRARALPLAA
jgi:hypothetical protein